MITVASVWKKKKRSQAGNSRLQVSAKIDRLNLYRCCLFGEHTRKLGFNTMTTVETVWNRKKWSASSIFAVPDDVLKYLSESSFEILPTYLAPILVTSSCKPAVIGNLTC